MKTKNFTNKQIRAASTLELVFRLSCLHAECERRPQDAGVPMPDIWEAAAMVKELRHRLGRLSVFFAGEKQ